LSVFIFFVIFLISSTLHAANFYWDGTGSLWNSASSWSLSSNNAVPDPSTIPGANDAAIFNITTLNSPQTIGFNNFTSIFGVTFNNTADTTFSSGFMNIGGGGININAAAGNVTLNTQFSLFASQAWSNSSSQTFSAAGLVALGGNTLSLLTPGTITISGNISGGGGLSLSGSGVINLSGNNSYSGTTSIAGSSTVNVLNPQALGAGGGATTLLTGSTINFNGQGAISEVLIIAGTGVSGAGAIINSNLAFNPVSLNSNIFISGAASAGGTSPLIFSASVSNLSLVSVATLTKVGTSTLTLSGSTDNTLLGLTLTSGSVILGKASTASVHALGSGLTIASGATLQLAGSGDDQIADSASVINDGTFDLNGHAEAIDGLSGTGAITNTSSAGSATLTLGARNTSSTFSGTIIDGASTTGLTKLGTGALTLSGNNTFSGSLSVAGGSLLLASTSSLGLPSSIAVAGGTTLDLGGNSSATALLTLQGTLLNTGIFPSFLGGNINTAATPDQTFSLTISGLSQITFTGGFNNTSGSTQIFKLGTNTLTLAGATDNTNLSLTASAGAVILAKNSSPSVHALGGNLTINGATIYLAGSGNDQIADSASVILNSGTLDTRGTSETFASLAGTGGLITNSLPSSSILTFGNGASVSFAGTIQDGAGSLSLHKTGNATTTLTGPYSATGPLFISAGKIVFASLNHTLQFQSLSLSPSSILDLTNHDALIGNSTLSAVSTQILAGFNLNSPAPGTPAITSSTALASHQTFLVPLDADALLGNGTSGSAIGKSFDSTPITQPSTILIIYTLFGDLTLDGTVDGLDYATLIGHFGIATPGTNNISQSWQLGDFNLDGTVNAADLVQLQANLNTSLGSLSTNLPGTPAIPPSIPIPTPEPSTLVFLILALTILLSPRRR
jgi:autotransporter-associated beta strand protein